VTELAFQGNLIPLRTADDRSGSQPTEPMSKPAGNPTISTTSTTSLPAADGASEAAVDPVEAPAGQTVRYRESDPPEASHQELEAVPARVRKPESLPPPQADSASPATAWGSTMSVRTNPDRAPGQLDHPGAPEPAPNPEPIQSRIESELPPAPAAPRDIKLEVNSGGQRVEVLVADRGGDVHVAVRTSDTHLAGALRDDLPALSSRLEQTGLRAEAWHTPAPAGGDWRRDGERLAGSGSHDSSGQTAQDAREQPGDRGRRQPRGTEKKVYEEQPHRKDKEREFAWFMSSLR